jgi:hypothetical protein
MKARAESCERPTPPPTERPRGSGLRPAAGPRPRWGSGGRASRSPAVREPSWTGAGTRSRQSIDRPARPRMPKDALRPCGQPSVAQDAYIALRDPAASVPPRLLRLDRPRRVGRRHRRRHRHHLLAGRVPSLAPSRRSSARAAARILPGRGMNRGLCTLCGAWTGVRVFWHTIRPGGGGRHVEVRGVDGGAPRSPGRSPTTRRTRRGGRSRTTSRESSRPPGIRHGARAGLYGISSGGGEGTSGGISRWSV